MTRDKASPAGLVTGIQCTAAAVAMALASGTAAAQTGEDRGEDQAVEEIVVTGSRLIRRDFSAPSPIASIGQEAIRFSGQATLETALNKMPQVTPSFDRTSNNPGNGTAAVNLRGLGSGRTLVMLNGRRLASAGIGSSVDVNSLPQSLIERVEVITGGATTVYGSDAVAGVVNFITRSDLDGFGLDATAYSTEEGDSDIYDVDFSYGHQFSNGNIAVYGSYYDREPLFGADRPTGQFAWVDVDGELVQGGSSATPEGTLFSPRVDFGDGQGPVRVIWDGNGNPRPFVSPDDFYNYAPVNYLQLPMKRQMGGALANFDIAGDLELYAELAYTRAEVTQNLAPVPIFAGLAVNLDNPILTPANQQFLADNLFPAGPNQVAGFFGRRMLESGARVAINENEYSRAVVGLRGDLTENWEFDAWVIYNDSDQEGDLLNAILFSRLQQGLLVDPVTGQCFDPSNGCVPVDIFGPGRMSAEAVDFIRAPVLRNPIQRTQKSVNAFVRGDLFSTWAGSVQSAIGVEWRSDEGSFRADDLIFAGDVVGYNGDAPVNGEETVSEIYAEAIVPLAEDTFFADYLSLELGGRYSDYKNAGGVESWKAGVEWVFNDTLRIRSMRQRSVRAPNLLEAFQERFGGGTFPFVQATPDEDLCSASANPVQAGRTDKCVLQGIPLAEVGTWEATPGTPTEFFGGGNTALTPEIANTFTVGFVLTPDMWPNVQISVDYFDMEIEDTIGDLVPDIACFDQRNVEGLFCDRMIRDPVTYDVIRIEGGKVNKGVLRTSGIDVQLNWSRDLPDGLAIGDAGADIVVDIIYTKMLENAFQELSFGTEFDCAGRFGFPCSFEAGTTFPSNRMMTNVNYRSGKVGIFLNWRWIESTRNAREFADIIFGDPPSLSLIDTIPRENYVDLGFSFDFSDNISARLTVANLFDKEPAFMAHHGQQANTDPSMFDVFGRSYTLGFSLQY